VTRRAAAGAAAVLLLALVLASQTWAELPRRARFLAAFAPRELAVRRLGGSGTAFDRRYFSFLENVRRSVPAAAKGVMFVGVPEDEAHFFLADYQFAPRPMFFGRAGGELPAGWVTATFGPPPAPDAAVLARFPEGYLEGPRP
jgi:hypothetical protein